MATTIRYEKLFCLKCGGEFIIKFPIEMAKMNKKIKAFEELHKDCEQTWVEPKADQSKDVKEKAMWWIENGETGSSSKTMWNCLIGNKDFAINHPYDPDDFSRCYKLLETVPEWKTELHKLKPLSKEWSNLVDNWSELEKMFLKHDKNMYEFMQTLIKH